MLLLLSAANPNPNPNPNPTGDENVIDIDIALVREFMENRNGPAFTRIMTKYKNTVYAFCFRYTGNRQDAEDIAQEVFIRVYRYIETFRGESRFSSWLYRLTVNTCHNYVRRRKRFRIPGMVRVDKYDLSEDRISVEVPDTAADPEQSLINKELGMIIRISVARLRGRQRSVVILKDFLGRSYEEIARIMNMSMGSVKSTLSRGRLKVAKHIREFDKP